jgi:glutamate dehydrogenase
VNISNVAALTDTEGKPHFKYIVEGANLFFTQQARLHLEKRRVIMFKDSSANKGEITLYNISHGFDLASGGVTSSSLEVLAGLALTTQEYLDLMVFKDGKPSDFYKNYVKDIQAKIAENAASEFHCIWQEHARLQGAKPRTQISDELSIMLNELHTKLEHSDLFEDVPSRKGVMRRAIPTTLVKQVGLDALLERLPVQYQRALFSSWVSSHFVSFNYFSMLHEHHPHLPQIYKYGVNSSTIDFFHFARDLAWE